MVRVNAAGTPEIRVLNRVQLAQPPTVPVFDDVVDKQLVQQMNNLKLVDEEKTWRQVDVPKPNILSEDIDEPIIDVAYSSLRSSDLAIKSTVNVRTINNPSDFIVNEYIY